MAYVVGTPALRERITTLAHHIDDHRKRVLAQPSAPRDLTLTNLYNVREALRAGRPLTDKEKLIHTLGLVGVPYQLHNELDAAVLQAYGWADLTAGLATAPGTEPHTPAEGELLHCLVALNTRRAAEEASGTVRWLRPDFQNSAKISTNEAKKQEQIVLINQAVYHFEVDEIDVNKHSNTFTPGQPPATANAAIAPATATQPWPATLPEQVRAVADVLAASPLPLSLSAIEARFKGKGPWKKGLPLLLQTLQALGRAKPVEVEGGEVVWRA